MELLRSIVDGHILMTCRRWRRPEVGAHQTVAVLKIQIKTQIGFAARSAEASNANTTSATTNSAISTIIVTSFNGI